MIKVVKFGGTSLSDAVQFRKVADIIHAEDSRRYVVVSAPGKRYPDDEKITDMLYECYNLARDKKAIDSVFDKIEDRYNEIIKDLDLKISLNAEFERIKTAILNHAGRDYIASRGEYLNAIVMADFLGFDFIEAESGIFFSDDGMLDSEKTFNALSHILSLHTHAVVPGFYGVMPNGTIKTFPRSGSDITGSLIARAVNSDLYENWTDVSGMLMADPRCVDNPEVIDYITYRELRELAYMGANVLHEDAIFPVRESGIPINIRNTNSPSDPGTMIVPEVKNGDMSSVITGVAGKKGFSTITVEKDMMNSELGFGRRVLEVLENHKISFEHLPSGIDAMSVIVTEQSIHNCRDSIISELIRSVSPDSVFIEDGLALISVVGRSMIGAKGTAGRIFSALAEKSINIKMIDQGSSEINIIIGVDENDLILALNAIYHEFVDKDN